MKKLILSISLFVVGVGVYAQQDAQFTQNMFNKLAINPGEAGSNGGICFTLLSRTQWTGFDGHPQTHLFSADALIFNKHGIGLTVFQDKLGIETSLVAKLAYSYHLTLGPGSLGIGVDAGLLSKSFGTGFIAVDDYTLDPSIPNGSTSANAFDLGLGLYYNIPNKMYIGISTLHLTASELKDVANGGAGVGALTYAQSRHYYIMAGYDWDVNGSGKWVVKPSLLAKTDAASTQLDVNALLMYNNLVWGGVTYRIEDAIAVLAGVNIPQLPGLKIGASYDITTSTLGDYSNGSLEFMIKYCTNITKPAKREVYHSVRFL